MNATSQPDIDSTFNTFINSVTNISNIKNNIEHIIQNSSYGKNSYIQSIQSYCRNYPCQSFYNIEQKTALYIATEKEDVEIVKLLLGNDKIDVNIKAMNQQTREEKTALHIATL